MKRLTLFFAIAFAIGGCSKASDSGLDGPVIPVSIESIEAINVDNSGRLPVVAAANVPKNGYMLGVKWITDNTPSDANDKFITGPIKLGEKTYSSLSQNYSKAIKCNTAFNSKIAPGSYVSKFFKEVNSNYLPVGVDEGYVLLVAPDPGKHSFTVEYYSGSVLKFSYTTSEIDFI